MLLCFLADGISRDPCSSTYCGAFGLSEPETKAVAAEGSRLSSNLRAYVTFHCTGLMWMHSWGTLVNHTGSPPQDCEIAIDEVELVQLKKQSYI